MRTTVDIPDELYEEATSKAAQEGIPVGELIAQGLRLALGETSPSGRQRITFPLHYSSRPGTLSVEVVRAAEEDVARQEDAAHGGTL